MRVRVEYFGTIRDHIPVGFEIVEMPARATVMDVVGRVLTVYGEELGTILLAPQGEPLPNLVLTVNGVRIIEPIGMRKELCQEDVVTLLLMPPFTGGG